MLKKICEAYHLITIHSNGGDLTDNLIGNLKKYPNPVWFDPNGIYNTLSMAEVLEFFKVELNYKENKLIVHFLSGISIEFFKIPESIFYHGLITKGNKKLVVTVDMIKEHMEGYPRRKFVEDK